MYDTIIIGAGMSGLAAGIRLAYYGQRVCILERHNTIGGLNSFYRHGGRDFDVGLHAVTNFTPRGTRRGPLARLLRQLRFQWDEFELAPQLGSCVVFPDVRLAFNNDIRLLETEIAREFPAEIDHFQRLKCEVVDYDALEPSHFGLSARTVLGEFLRDPLLREMLLCPLMWYGNAREHDMDYGQFCIMFRSIYLEGFARPFAGVRLILRKLVRKFRTLGGELKLRSGVKRLRSEGRRVTAVVLDDDTELESQRVLSSAGWVETMRMCGQVPAAVSPREAGVLSFVETISVLDRPPRRLGHDDTIVFFNDSPQFTWSIPGDDLCDVRTGVICSPNNYAYSASCGELPDGVMRITALANYDRWVGLPDDAYRVEKLGWYDRVVDSAVRFVPDYRRFVIDTDMFTPRTIQRYTGKDNGAVYGSPQKRLDGTTPLENLFLCGTDQGFVGIVGAIVSGISMANQHCLRESAAGRESCRETS